MIRLQGWNRGVRGLSRKVNSPLTVPSISPFLPYLFSNRNVWIGDNPTGTGKVPSHLAHNRQRNVQESQADLGGATWDYLFNGQLLQLSDRGDLGE